MQITTTLMVNLLVGVITSGVSITSTAIASKNHYADKIEYLKLSNGLHGSMDNIMIVAD